MQRPDQPARTAQHNGGASGQVTHRRGRRRTRERRSRSAAAFDRSAVGFAQSTELGYLNPDRSVTGVGAFGDGGVTGGDVDGEPFDTRVDLDGHVTTWSVYRDRHAAARRAHAPDAVGPLQPHADREPRSDRARRRPRLARRRPRLQPLQPGGRRHRSTLAPGVNALRRLQRRQPRRHVDRARLRRTRRSRASCRTRWPAIRRSNQVVTRTVEGGHPRHAPRGCRWNAGAFRADNRDDILFVTSRADRLRLLQELRQDPPAGTRARRPAASFGRVDARRRLHVPARDLRERGDRQRREQQHQRRRPKTANRVSKASIEIEPGDRLPLIPRHLFKAFGDVAGHRRLVARRRSRGDRRLVRARQREQPARTGRHLLSRATAPVDGYAVVNLGARYRADRRVCR